MIAYDLARIYFGIISSRFHHYIAYAFNRSKDPRKTKYWKVFMDLYEVVKDDSSFNMYWYVEAQIAKTGKMVWPGQLVTKQAVKNYHEFLKSKEIVVKGDDEKEIAYALQRDKEAIDDWMNQNPGKDIKDFFNDKPKGLLMSDGIYYSMMRFLSPYFLSISKNFWRAYKDLDEDMRQELPSEQELKIARSKIYQSNVLKEKAKKYFDEEVII